MPTVDASFILARGKVEVNGKRVATGVVVSQGTMAFRDGGRG
jgi:hypothetical protein